MLAQIEASIFEDRDALAMYLNAGSRSTGSKLVFTNGCFDILHRGHVHYLVRARQLGDLLVLGLNSDASVQRLKGPGRPINAWYDRAFVLAGLKAVDFVVFFDEDLPNQTISILKPEIHCKGGDYRPEELPERSTVLAGGGRIEILNFVDGYSTTQTLMRSRQKDA